MGGGVPSAEVLKDYANWYKKFYRALICTTTPKWHFLFKVKFLFYRVKRKRAKLFFAVFTRKEKINCYYVVGVVYSEGKDLFYSPGLD